MSSLYEIEVQSIDGTRQTLAAHAGKVLLIVNVASQCGFTPQYAGLQNLYREHRDGGLVILGFPCNQFGGQEPEDSAGIRQFCSSNYGVSFPMFARIEVNGRNTHPVYQYLKSSAKGIFGSQAIKWNFTKFLVDRDGRVVRRFAPFTRPEAIQKAVVALLA